MGQPVSEPMGDPSTYENRCPICGEPEINGKINHAFGCPLRENDDKPVEPFPGDE